MKLVLKYTFLLILLFQKLSAQDTQFSQYYSSVLYLNPSYAGVKKGPQYNVSYRNQWAGLGKPFQTYYASYDQYFQALHGGIGFQLLNDRQGNIYQNFQYALSYSFHQQISHFAQMSYAIQVGGIHDGFTSSSLLMPSNVLDGTIGGFVSPEPQNALDISSGLGYSSKHFYGGIAVHHIGQFFSKNTLNPIKLTINLGTKFNWDPLDLKRSPIEISPNIVFQQQQQFFQQLSYGVYVTKKSFTFGGWIRQNLYPLPGFDALIGLIGINFPYFKVGYSYDVTLSRLRSYTWGTHEISCNLSLEPFEKISKRHAISCPSF